VKAANKQRFPSACRRCAALSDEVCGWETPALLPEPELESLVTVESNTLCIKRVGL